MTNFCNFFIDKYGTNSNDNLFTEITTHSINHSFKNITPQKKQQQQQQQKLNSNNDFKHE